MQVKIWVNLFCYCTLMVCDLYQYVWENKISVNLFITVLLRGLNSANMFGEKGKRVKILVNLFRN